MQLGSKGRSNHLPEIAEDLGLLRLLQPGFHLGQIVGIFGWFWCHRRTLKHLYRDMVLPIGSTKKIYSEIIGQMKLHQPDMQASPKPSSGSLHAPAFSLRSWGVVARCADVTGGSRWAPLVPASSTPSAHPARRSSHPSPIAANRPYPLRFPAIGSPTCSIHTSHLRSNPSPRPIPDLWKLNRGVCSPGPNNQQDSTFSRKVPAGSLALHPRFLFRVSGTLQRFP